jgi:hypothetical protein
MRNGAETWGNKIGISWQAPDFDGGSSILSYRVLGNVDGSNFEVLAEGITA